MKKLIKIFAYLIITIVAVIVLAVGGILMFINPNQFKPQITEFVQKNANVILLIDGDLEWTFYPWIGIKVHNISLASPNTPTVPMANIKSAQVSILLKSLLNHELNISDVVVDGLTVSLLRDQKGNTNWSFVAKDSSSTTEEVNTTNKQSEENGVKTTPNVYIKSVSIKDANLVYKDALSNQAIALKNLSLNIGEVRVNQPINIDLKSGYALFNPKIEGELTLTSVIDFNSEKKYLQVRELKLKNDLKMTDLQLLTDLSGILDVDLNAQLIQLSNLFIQNNGQYQDVDIQDLTIKSLVKADLQKEIINVDQMQLAMRDLEVSGGIIVESYANDKLKFMGNIHTNTFNLKKLLTQLKIELPIFASKTALEKVTTTFSVTGNLKNIDVNPIQFKIDETTMTGSAAIVLAKIPTIAIALKGDQLVIDHYLPPKQIVENDGQKKIDVHSNTKVPMNPEIIPVLPNTMNVVVDMQLDKLLLDQLQLVDSKVKGSLKKGDVVLEQLQTSIYGGSLSFNGSLKGDKNPKLMFNGKIQKIDLTKILPQISLKDYINSDFLLSRLNENHKNIGVEGIVDGDFVLTTTGRLQNQIISNLNGEAKFELMQGRIDNLNYEKLMCQGIALLNQKPLTDSFSRSYTDFQKLSGKIIIRNGVVTNDPLQMLIPGIALNGKGDINLNRMMINYRVNAILTGDHSINPDPACQINERFKGIPIPIICEGSLEKTEGLCRLDTDQLGKVALNLVKNAAKDKVRKEIDQQKDKLQDQLDNEIEKQIKKNPAIKGILKNLL